MGIPQVSLDDRRFQDIVDEAKLQISEKFPEWTNHNVSDPGVALIELFAWMTEMTLYRLNHLPERAQRWLLDAVGFEVAPPRAAEVDLVFRLAKAADKPEVIAAGTSVGTGGNVEQRAIYETDDTVEVAPPRHDRTVSAAVGRPTTFPRIDDDDEIVCFLGLDAAHRAWEQELDTLDLSRRRHWRPTVPFDGDATYFGFAGSLAAAVVRMIVTVGDADADAESTAPPGGFGIKPEAPPLIWEASTADGWVRCEVDDDTKGLIESGDIEIQFPPDHATTFVDGHGADLYWLRVRIDLDVSPLYRSSPRLRRVDFETVGAVARARHAERHGPEILGESDGRAGQSFMLGNRPVLARRQADLPETAETSALPSPERLTVDGEPWREVPDFRNATHRDLVYTIDSTTGHVRFGPCVRHETGSVQHGAIPPEGAQIVLPQYRKGGGEHGNRDANTIRSLRSALKNVVQVDNPRPATGGLSTEATGAALERAPMTVRAGDRAVSADDFVRLVRDSAPDVHRVVARRPELPGSPLRLLIVPGLASPSYPDVLHIDDLAIPRALSAQIHDHLEPRRVVGSNVRLTTPNYQGLSVAVLVRPKPANGVGQRDDDNLGIVRKRVLEALYRFISPLTGGEAGRGLDFGESITVDRVRAAIGAVQGVSDIIELDLFSANLRTGKRIGPGRQHVVVSDDTILMSLDHVVIVETTDGRRSHDRPGEVREVRR